MTKLVLKVSLRHCKDWKKSKKIKHWYFTKHADQLEILAAMGEQICSIIDDMLSGNNE